MSGGRVIRRDFILKESQQAFLKVMIKRFFDINDMRSARNDFQRGAVRQTVQASVDQVVVQVGILITANDQGRCTDLCQIYQNICVSSMTRQ